jgi:DNA-binding winged helix-turn-helix (wHTH) protein
MPPHNDLLRSHLYELRRAVDAPFASKLIHTVPGIGYRMSDEPRLRTADGGSRGEERTPGTQHG